MSRLRPRFVAGALLASLLAGLAAGLVPGRGEGPTDYDEAVVAAARASEPGDRVAAAAADVREDGLHVAPELADRLSDAEVAELERAVAASPVPLHVVWWQQSYLAGYRTDYAALAQLRVEVAEDGYYAIVSDGGSVLVAANGLRDPFIDANGLGRPADALGRVVDELAAVPAEPPYERGPGSDYWGGPGGGIAAALLFVALGYGVLVPIVLVVGRLRR